jgi:hypothetical protein
VNEKTDFGVLGMSTTGARRVNMTKKYRPNRPASNADAITRNRAKRRERIGHQIDTIMQRHDALQPNDPARKGIERTVERLNIECQAED